MLQRQSNSSFIGIFQGLPLQDYTRYSVMPAKQRTQCYQYSVIEVVL